MLVTRKSKTIFIADKPVIGSKYSGKNISYNSQSGEYWEVMPTLTAEDIKLQKGLLKKFDISVMMLIETTKDFDNEVSKIEQAVNAFAVARSES